MKVLVIGGGLGGASTIVGLRKKDKATEIILVEPKDYAETCWAAYRSPFDEATAKASMHPLKPFCEKNNVKHIQSVVSELKDDKATLANGEVVEFDVCVIATGAATKWPALGRGTPADHGGDGKRESHLKAVKEEGEKLLSSGSVLIVGGGLIGTEVAGELADRAKTLGKSLSVTLVQAHEHLCPEMSPKAAAMTQRKLEKLGVKVYLKQKAVEKDGQWVLENSGEVLHANAVVKTVGISSINSFYHNSASSESKNEAGFMNTDEFFRVKGSGGKIFAIGDCCTTLPNSGSQILNNVKVIGANVKTTLDAAKDGKLDGLEHRLKKASPAPFVYLATVGTSDGVMYSSLFHTQRFFPWLKNKTMFLFRIKYELGLKTDEN